MISSVFRYVDASISKTLAIMIINPEKADCFLLFLLVSYILVKYDEETIIRTVCIAEYFRGTQLILLFSCFYRFSCHKTLKNFLQQTG